MSAAAHSLIFECPRCGNDLPAQEDPVAQFACPVCTTNGSCFAFPALAAERASQPDQPVIASEASCYFHEDRVAAFTCSQCGRFLCNLCRIGWGGRDLCSSCVQDQKHESTLISSLFQYDSLALAVSVFGGLTFIFSTMTAPISLGLALLTIGKQSSITPRSKWRSILTIVLSLAQIVGWIFLFVYSARRARVSPT